MFHGQPVFPQPLRPRVGAVLLAKYFPEVALVVVDKLVDMLGWAYPTKQFYHRISHLLE